MVQSCSDNRDATVPTTCMHVCSKLSMQHALLLHAQMPEGFSAVTCRMRPFVFACVFVHLPRGTSTCTCTCISFWAQGDLWTLTPYCMNLPFKYSACTPAAHRILKQRSPKLQTTSLCYSNTACVNLQCISSANLYPSLTKQTKKFPFVHLLPFFVILLFLSLFVSSPSRIAITQKLYSVCKYYAYLIQWNPS